MLDCTDQAARYRAFDTAVDPHVAGICASLTNCSCVCSAMCCETQVLDVHNNQLTGNLPPSLVAMPDLVKLRVSKNSLR